MILINMFGVEFKACAICSVILIHINGLENGVDLNFFVTMIHINVFCGWLYNFCYLFCNIDTC